MAIAASTFRAGEHDRVIGAVVNRLVEPAADFVGRLRVALEQHGAALRRRRAATGPRSVGRGCSTSWRDLDVHGAQRGRVGHRRVKDVSVCAQAVPGVLPRCADGTVGHRPGRPSRTSCSAICLAAMNGTRLAGLLLTFGVEPDPGVWELCRPAAATGLPVLLTPLNSYETATTVYETDPGVPADDAGRARAAMTVVAEALDSDWLTVTADGEPRATTQPARLPPAAGYEGPDGRPPRSSCPRAPSRGRCARRRSVRTGASPGASCSPTRRRSRPQRPAWASRCQTGSR